MTETPTRRGDALRRLGLETVAALAVPLGIAAVLRWPSRTGGKRAMIGPSGWVCTKGCTRRPGYRGEHCEHHPASR
jgi:hypothetical protein